MSGTPLSPYNPYLLEAPKNESLQKVISEKGNAFRAFDWDDYVITTRPRTGLIASSKPYWSPTGFRGHVWNSDVPLGTKAWDQVMQSVCKLGSEYSLPFKTIDKFYIARGNSDQGFHVINMGIDVSKPVDKADAEAFVQQCSDILASHKLEDAVVEVHHCTYWGDLAER